MNKKLNKPKNKLNNKVIFIFMGIKILKLLTKEIKAHFKRYFKFLFFFS